MRPILAAAVACSQLVLACTIALAQPVLPAPSPTPVRETSVTLSQIVARQKTNFDRIKTAQGQVVWTELRGGSPSTTSAPASRVICFAFEPERRVNLVLPVDEFSAYTQSGGRINWSRVLSAVQILGDEVRTLTPRPGSNDPQVARAPFNPAVHEHNPLVAFHPQLLADERVTLADLAASVARMPTPPRLSEFRAEGRLFIRIDFSNAAIPGEAIYYVVDPDKAWLPVEITRLSGGRVSSRIRIVVGTVKDGTFIPARRDKDTYDTQGRVLSRESWYYKFLSVNEPLARRATSLAFFGMTEQAETTNATPPPHSAP